MLKNILISLILYVALYAGHIVWFIGDNNYVSGEMEDYVRPGYIGEILWKEQRMEMEVIKEDSKNDNYVQIYYGKIKFFNLTNDYSHMTMDMQLCRTLIAGKKTYILYCFYPGQKEKAVYTIPFIEKLPHERR